MLVYYQLKFLAVFLGVLFLIVVSSIVVEASYDVNKS